MLTKKIATKLVKSYLDSFIEMLSLQKANIQIHIYYSKSKKLKDLGVRVGTEVGCCYSASIKDNHDIILHYDRHHSEREFVSTLVHELLHVKLSKLTGCVTMAATKANLIEEHLVRDLEQSFIDLIWPK
jgi:hypothetical protein